MLKDLVELFLLFPPEELEALYEKHSHAMLFEQTRSPERSSLVLQVRSDLKKTAPLTPKDWEAAEKNAMSIMNKVLEA